MSDALKSRCDVEFALNRATFMLMDCGEAATNPVEFEKSDAVVKRRGPR